MRIKILYKVSGWLLAVILGNQFLYSCNETDRTINQSSTKNKIDVYDDTSSNQNNTAVWPASFGFGQKLNPVLLKRIDISIPPNGKGLPEGEGLASNGQTVYMEKCAGCHGKTGVEGPFDHLVYSDTSTAKTIGNYWPYATTVFDYIRRAMPYNKPGSLTNVEVYQLTAFLLYKNKIIDEHSSINATSLPKIEMPGKKLFVNDNRKGGSEVH